MQHGEQQYENEIDAVIKGKESTSYEEERKQYTQAW